MRILRRSRVQRQRRALVVLFWWVFGVGILVSCGVKKDPVAPLRRLPHPPEFTLRQQGESIFVEGAIRPTQQNGDPLEEAVVTIWRSEQPSDMQRFPPQEVFRREATLAATLTLRPATEGGAFSFEDTYPAGKTDKAFFYGVEVRNERGRRSEAAKIARIAPLRFAARPDGFVAEVTEKAIVLRWNAVAVSPAHEEAATASADDAQETPRKSVEKSDMAAPEKRDIAAAPWKGARYVVLRSEEGGTWTPLTSAPIEDTTFYDMSFTFGRAYAYRVRSIVEFGAESADSETLVVRPTDVFPPATPEGFAASVEGSVIRLFWLPNQELDLAGYHLYRARNGGALERLTEAPTEKTVFVDENVEVGGRYAYRLTAVDRAGNESPATPFVERLVRPETALP